MAEYTIKTGTLAEGTSLGTSCPRKVARDSSGNLYVVYHRSDGTRNQIYCSKSIDNGQNWTETKVTNDGIAHQQPTIAIDSADRIFIVCMGIVSTYYNPQCTKSIDGGGTWNATVTILTTSANCSYPCIAIDNEDIIHVIYLYGSTYLLYQKSINQGVNWSDYVSLVYNAPPGYLYEFALAIDNNDNIHVVWVETVSTYRQIRYITSTNGGANWSAITTITSENTNKYRPSVACDSSGNIHVVYEDVISTYYQIRYTVYTDSWSAPVSLTTGNYTHAYSTIAIDASNIITVFFYGYHAGSTTYRQIGYNIYNGSWGGMTWLSSDNAQHRFPNLIWASFPLIGAQRTNRPKTGYFLIFAEEAIIKCEVSANLTWDAEEEIVKTFEDAGEGTETLLTDKILSILDSGEGIDVLKADKPVTFIDGGEGTDIFTAIKEVIEKLFEDSGIGIDTLKTDKALIITDAGVGVDTLKTDKVLIIVDVGIGVDTLKTMKLLLYTDTGLGVESLTAGIIMSIKDTFSLQPEDLISLTNIHTVMDAPSRIIYGKLSVKYSEDLTVEYTKDDIIQFSLLEEEEYSSVPTSVDDISRISANELTFSLYNINKQFNIYNADSPLYGKIKKNIQVIAHLGAKVGDDIEWHQLGVFYIQTWDIPESGVTATFNAWDRLETLRNSTYLGGEVQVDATLYELAEDILQDAGLTPDQYQLDVKLQEVTIPYAWFDRGSHRDALKKIATLVNGKLYCNRQGKLIFEVR